MQQQCRMFSGKTVFITGAASKIGTATALNFAKLGAKLALTDSKYDELTKVSSKCEELYKCTTLNISGELTNESHCKNAIKLTVEHLKTLDVLVNNEEILEFSSIEGTSLFQFDRVFNKNVRSMYCLTMLALPHLIDSKGNIVNLSGSQIFPRMLAYRMSKSAVDEFTLSLANDLMYQGVRVNSVNPGAQNIFQRCSGWRKEFEHKLMHGMSLNECAYNKEVAKLICFVSSKEATFINGINFKMDNLFHL